MGSVSTLLTAGRDSSKMCAEVTVSQDEKRQVLGIVYWDAETNSVSISPVDSIPVEEIYAILKSFDFSKMKLCPKPG